MKNISDILRDLTGPDTPVSEDASKAIADGLSCASESDDGLPLGWEGVEVVQP